MPTDFAALDALHPLPPEELSRQWLLSCDGPQGPEGWRRLALGGLHLAVHPDARVTALASREGDAIGWAMQADAHLGEAGDHLPGDQLALPLPSRFSPEEAERALYGRGPDGCADGTGLVGPWTAVLRSADGACCRLYLGPTHSAVAWPERRLVAAVSPTLFPGLERDPELSRAVDPLATNRFYPFGLTPFRGVVRLLPNHALVLPECRPVRHWPPPRGLGAPVALDAAARRIVGHAHRVLTVQARTYAAFVVPLSAGRDSRAVLACLRPFAEGGPRVELATTRAARLRGAHRRPDRPPARCRDRPAARGARGAPSCRVLGPRGRAASLRPHRRGARRALPARSRAAQRGRPTRRDRPAGDGRRDGAGVLLGRRTAPSGALARRAGSATPYAARARDPRRGGRVAARSAAGPRRSARRPSTWPMSSNASAAGTRPASTSSPGGTAPTSRSWRARWPSRPCSGSRRRSAAGGRCSARS